MVNKKNMVGHRSCKVADEVWIATALLHREQPERQDFAVDEIVRRADAERVTGAPLRAGVRIHVHQHCVANLAPISGRYRMLFETSHGQRRLFRPGDACHPRRCAGRRPGKDAPREEEMPPAYRHLLEWYRHEYVGPAADPILALRGVGRELWADETADDYVRRLREGW